MFGKALLLGIITAIFSSFGAILYGNFYNTNLFDFSMVIGPVSIVTVCVIISVFAAFGFWLSEKVFKSWGEFVFNLLFCLGTMGSILSPINFQFPPAILEQVHAINGVDTEMFFPIYAIPMHFFPVLVWMTFKPLFYRKRLA